LPIPTRGRGGRPLLGQQRSHRRCGFRFRFGGVLDPLAGVDGDRDGPFADVDAHRQRPVDLAATRGVQEDLHRPVPCDRVPAFDRTVGQFDGAREVFASDHVPCVEGLDRDAVAVADPSEVVHEGVDVCDVGDSLEDLHH
jgi:hypothetical protein